MQASNVVTDDVERRKLRAGSRYLHRHGYRKTERECPCDGCEGVLWYDSHEFICNDCSFVLDKADQRRQPSSGGPLETWRQFWTSRPEYHNTETPKCPGGFLQAYDWHVSDEVDGLVTDMDPSQFYR